MCVLPGTWDSLRLKHPPKKKNGRVFAEKQTNKRPLIGGQEGDHRMCARKHLLSLANSVDLRLGNFFEFSLNQPVCSDCEIGPGGWLFSTNKSNFAFCFLLPRDREWCQRGTADASLFSYVVRLNIIASNQKRTML